MEIRRDPAFILFGKDARFYAWRPVGLFFVAYFGAYLGAAILTPLIYWAVQAIPGGNTPHPLLEYLQGQPFTRYVDRVRMIFSVGLLVWLIRYCGIWGRFGFFWRQQGIRKLSVFILLGLFAMGLIIAGQSQFSEYVLRNGSSLPYLVFTLSVSLAGALILGWFEEAIFRGLLFRMFYTATQPMPAVILGALVFAGMHFKKVPWLNGIEVEWYTGFYVASLQSISFLFTLEWMIFWNYVLVGIVLNLVFMRTRSLVTCMGLHAGWVLARNFWRKLVDVPSDSTNQFWGTERIVDGFACMLILSVLAVIFYVNWRNHQAKEQVDLDHPA